MVEGVERTRTHYKVQTMMVTGATGERQIITSYFPRDRSGQAQSRRARRCLKCYVNKKDESAGSRKCRSGLSTRSFWESSAIQRRARRRCRRVSPRFWARSAARCSAPTTITATTAASAPRRACRRIDPRANYLDILEQALRHLREGDPILKPVYDHRDGTFGRPKYVKPKEFVIAEGLLGYTTRAMRDCYDVKIYLDPDEDLRVKWKIHRDTTKRGYTPGRGLGVAREAAGRRPEIHAPAAHLRRHRHPLPEAARRERLRHAARRAPHPAPDLAASRLHAAVRRVEQCRAAA